jgi:hypothetical protein
MLERGHQAMQAQMMGEPVAPPVVLGASASGSPAPTQAHPVRDEFLAAFEATQSKMHELEDLFAERLQALARIGAGMLQTPNADQLNMARQSGPHFIPPGDAHA